MVPTYLFLHVPVQPIHYPFDKIGHYHLYENVKQYQKNLNLLSSFLSSEHAIGEKYQLLCSSFTYNNLSLNFQHLIAKQLDWQYENIIDEYNQANFSLKAIEQITKENIQISFLDLYTQDIVKLDTSVFQFTPNELQKEVLTELEYLKKYQTDNIKYLQNLNWFLNADHIHWMMHKPIHKIFNSPLGNVYDTYINFMNMLSDFKQQYKLNL